MATHPYGWEFIDRQDASASATIDIVFPSGYTRFLIMLEEVVPASDGQTMRFRLSTDGGSTFDSTNEYDRQYAGTINSTIQTASAQGEIVATAASGNVGGEHLSGQVEIYAPLSSSLFTHGNYIITYFDQAGTHRHGHGNFRHITAEVHDAFRFFMSAGNITSGSFTLFGLKLPSS